MASPSRFAILRETDLGIEDGPITGIVLRDILKRLFTQINGSLDATNKVTAKGVTLGENIRCDLLTAKATHGVAFPVRLKTLAQAQSCLVTGGDTLLPFPVASVQMLQPSQAGGAPTANVTVWFQGGTGAATVRLWLFDDGQQATATPAWTSYIAKPAVAGVNGQLLTQTAGLPAWAGDAAWTVLAYSGTWAAGARITPGYRKDGAGRVWARGTVTGGAATTIAVLPTGYRPSATMIWMTDHNAAAGAVSVDSSGNVVTPWPAAAFTNIALDGISFDAL